MELTREEIIEKLKSFINGEISREELVKWASAALDRTTIDTDDLINSALMDLWSLHDEWGVNKDDLLEILQRLQGAEKNSELQGKGMAGVLVLTVGTTPEPLIKAVEEAYGEGITTISLLYGRPFPNQSPSPFDVASEVKRKAEALGLKTRLFEMPNPEDFNNSLRAAQEVLQEMGGADRLIINYTGGTKPLSAALTHAALTQSVTGEVEFDYVGGAVRDEAGRVVREAMRTRRSETTFTQKISRQTLDLLRSSQYAQAMFLAQQLPDLGRGSFIKQATRILFLWDELNYKQAVVELGHLQSTAKAFAEDSELGALAQTLLRLLKQGNTFRQTVQALECAITEDKAPSLPFENVALISSDILENASRRQKERRPTDAVLRSYRALEIALQGALLRHGINPWRPQWNQIPKNKLQEYQKKLKGNLPEELSLTSGIILWEVLNRPLTEEEKKKLKDLRYSRNHSYLEHGLERRSEKDVNRLLPYAQELVEAILNTSSVAPLRSKISHQI